MQGATPLTVAVWSPSAATSLADGLGLLLASRGSCVATAGIGETLALTTREYVLAGACRDTGEPATRPTNHSRAGAKRPDVRRRGKSSPVPPDVGVVSDRRAATHGGWALGDARFKRPDRRRPAPPRRAAAPRRAPARSTLTSPATQGPDAPARYDLLPSTMQMASIVMYGSGRGISTSAACRDIASFVLDFPAKLFPARVSLTGAGILFDPHRGSSLGSLRKWQITRKPPAVARKRVPRDAPRHPWSTIPSTGAGGRRRRAPWPT